MTLKSQLSKALSDRYWIIYLIAIAETLMCLVPGHVYTAIDTPSYIATWHSYTLSNWESIANFYRTPIYPVFAGILSAGGRAPFIWTAMAQWVIFIISIAYFRKLAMLLTRREKLTFWLTLFYTIYPGIIEANYYIMTESLSQSFVIFLIYFTARLLTEGSPRYFLISSAWLLVLEFLRPSFIYLLPIYVLLYIYCLIKGNRKAWIGLAGVAVVTGALFGYMKLFEHRYGYFASSYVSTFNNYARSIHFNYADESCFPESIRKKIHPTDSLGNGGWVEILPPGVPTSIEFKEGVAANIIAHKKEFIDATVRTFPRFWRSRWSQNYKLYMPLSFYISFTMEAACILILIYSVTLIGAMLRDRRIFAIPCLLCGIWLAQALVCWLGAYVEFGRLMQPVFPLLVLMTGQLCSFFTKTRTATQVFTP